MEDKGRMQEDSIMKDMENQIHEQSAFPSSKTEETPIRQILNL